MHQRSCRAIKGLEGETFETVQSEIDNSYDGGSNAAEQLDRFDYSNVPEIKPGIKLPKKDEQWKTANTYFAATLPLTEINPSNVNVSIKTMNSVIYDYFQINYGVSDDVINTNLIEKYKHKTKSSLKSCLKCLKESQAPLCEIRYVSRLLRSKVVPNSDTNNCNHDAEIQKNFWGYVKKTLKKDKSILPSFNVFVCTDFFRTFFCKLNPTKSFKVPDWIPSLSLPSVPYNLDPPSYHQITKVVRRMKSSGSPCPLDKLSIIPFKRCPYLRTYMTELIRIIWSSGDIPEEWKLACTVLIHKRGDASNPENFRPITLETIPLKIFTSCLRDSMFAFLSANMYIEHRIQKGFLPRLSGTFEHTAHMASIINKARIKQRAVVITLLDLKNAFGEVHHNLIPAVLRYHHIPEHIQNIICSLYADFKTSIITDTFRTPFIPVGRGVLQGDCLSPLTFNLCFNTFIHYISDNKFNQFGFYTNSLNPVHWFQFADDAAVVTGQENENQILLNHFSR
ncbi:uncharacterized protein LOC135691968 [Rhopilema esculentum]|uniref:uncharacterized protein LOC135691968 n=1 Tax=Rhopilema esculentum TaxID=499914 RepID=UPI0031DF7512